MTPKQKRFADEYLVCSNATQAAIKSGYSENAAEGQGSRLLSNAKVKAYIKERQERLAIRAEVTISELIAELRKLAFSNIADYLEFGKVIDGEGETIIEMGKTLTLKDWSKVPRELLAAVESVQTTRDGWKIKLYDKKAAIELLGRHIGAFILKIEHSGEIKYTEIESPVVIPPTRALVISEN